MRMNSEDAKKIAKLVINNIDINSQEATIKNLDQISEIDSYGLDWSDKGIMVAFSRKDTNNVIVDVPSFDKTKATCWSYAAEAVAL